MLLIYTFLLSFLSFVVALPLGRRGTGHFTGDGTFFQVGLGACGIVNTNQDFIVALNHVQFGGGYPGKYCFEEITITHNGVSHGAKITDMCPGCNYGDLDMSPALFDVFEPPSVGRFVMEWQFNNPALNPGPPAPPPKPTTHTTTKHTTTHTTTKHTSTTHHTTHTTHSTTSSAAPTPTPPTDTLQQLQLALIGLGGLVASSGPNSS